MKKRTRVASSTSSTQPVKSIKTTRQQDDEDFIYLLPEKITMLAEKFLTVKDRPSSQAKLKAMSLLFTRETAPAFVQQPQDRYLAMKTANDKKPFQCKELNGSRSLQIFYHVICAIISRERDQPAPQQQGGRFIAALDRANASSCSVDPFTGVTIYRQVKCGSTVLPLCGIRAVSQLIGRCVSIESMNRAILQTATQLYRMGYHMDRTTWRFQPGVPFFGSLSRATIARLLAAEGHMDLRRPRRGLSVNSVIKVRFCRVIDAYVYNI
jgi:hypothetical protein